MGSASMRADNPLQANDHGAVMCSRVLGFGASTRSQLVRIARQFGNAISRGGADVQFGRVGEAETCVQYTGRPCKRPPRRVHWGSPRLRWSARSPSIHGLAVHYQDSVARGFGRSGILLPHPRDYRAHPVMLPPSGRCPVPDGVRVGGRLELACWLRCLEANVAESNPPERDVLGEPRVWRLW